MRSFFNRSISGIIYALLFIGAIFNSKESYLTLIFIFAIICLWEFFKLLKIKNLLLYLFSLTSASLLFFISFQIPSLIHFFLVLSLSGSIQLLIGLFLKKKHYPAGIFSKIEITVRYLLLSFLFLALLPFVDGEYKESIILSPILFVWINDTFAFVVGKNLGRIKLFKTISPKKTVEGFVAGIVFTVVAAIILSRYIDFLSTVQWIVIALIVSVLGSLGDLVESKFKRQAKISDSGTIMPGHGGLLDRLDSLLFVAPFLYLYINYLI